MMRAINWNASPCTSGEGETANERRVEDVDDVPRVRTEIPSQLHARVVADAVFEVERVYDARDVWMVEGSLLATRRSMVVQR